MKRLFAYTATLALAQGTALAADPSPVGDWMVKDGYAIIRIDNCAGKMWGIVAWEKEAGKDTENPDPAKKGGRPRHADLIAWRRPSRTAGKARSTIAERKDVRECQHGGRNTLEGCLGRPLCQTQKWTRP